MSPPPTWRSRVPSSMSCVLGQAGVGADRGHRRLEEAHQRPGVEQHLAAHRAVRHRGEEALLALDPAEVGAGVEAARADVRQAGLAVDVARALRQPETGLAVPQPNRRADVHTAHGVDEPHEAQEVDLEVVVDVDAGRPLDRRDGQRRAAERVGRVELVAALADGGPVGAGVRGDRHVGVARQADDPHGAVRRGHLHQQHGVRAPSGGGGGGADVQPSHVCLRTCRYARRSPPGGTSSSRRRWQPAGRSARGTRRPARSSRPTTRPARSPTRRRAAPVAEAAAERTSAPLRSHRLPRPPRRPRSPADSWRDRFAGCRGLRCGGRGGDWDGTGNEARAGRGGGQGRLAAAHQ